MNIFTKTHSSKTAVIAVKETAVATCTVIH